MTEISAIHYDEMSHWPQSYVRFDPLTVSINEGGRRCTLWFSLNVRGDKANKEKAEWLRTIGLRPVATALHCAVRAFGRRMVLIVYYDQRPRIMWQKIQKRQPPKL